jgi:protein-disulfide isomerase
MVGRNFPMKRYLPFIIIAVVGMLTIGSGAMLYHAKLRAALKGGATANSAKSEMPPQHVRGASKAPVTLEEFADFQCPACAKTMMEMIRPLEKNYGSRLRVIFWHFPLPNHKHGRDAALAAEAASLQGRFWEMHDLLYQNQLVWSQANDARPMFNDYARELHLDVERFRKDFGSAQVAAQVDRQREHGVARGVENTPTIFINKQPIAPPFSPERLHEAIDAAMPGHKSS